MPDEFQVLQSMIRQLSEEVQTGFSGLHQRLDKIEKRLDAIEKELSLLNREVRNLSKKTLRIEVEHEDFDERLTKLEGNSGIQ